MNNWGRSTEDEDEEEGQEMDQRSELEREEERSPYLSVQQAALGACRADERQLYYYLQLFDPSEIALLVRCLCAPLVSIRVGNVNKIGSLLCPIPTRGRLNLNMAPASRLRISFVGDDGRTEQLCSISCNSSEVDSVIIEEIAADESGRSFLVKVSESQVLYYWLSEKSLSHGLDLLDKMKDVTRRKPTLSDLTGISRSRLDSLGTHLQACLVNLNLPVSQSIHSEITAPVSAPTSTSSSASASASVSASSQNARLPEASISPRSETCFTDNSSLSSSRTIGGIQDNRLKRRNYVPLVIPSLPFNSPSMKQSLPPSAALPSLSASLPPEFSPFNPLTFQFPLPSSDHAASIDNLPLFKPQYCWCPIGPSLLPSLPSLPPFDIAPPAAASSSLSLATPASSDCSKVLHDPLVHLALPVSSLVIPPLPSSSQFPAFSGLMSDSIVHFPVMDISSAGQAYLVSAGPTISTAISPLAVKPLVPATDSVVEKNARETLMRLLESTPMSNPIHGVVFGVNTLSSVISSSLEEDMSCQTSEREENEEWDE